MKNEGLESRESEIKSLRRQLDSTSEELTEMGRAREVALRENRRLQEDLATMTHENQVKYRKYREMNRLDSKMTL